MSSKAHVKNEFVIERSVVSVELYWPPESALASEDHFARGYRDMRGFVWEDAYHTLKEEQETLVRLAGALSVTEMAISSEGYPGFYDLDVGVAAAVVALSAANCAPISSCNGEPSHHELYPLVAFYCRKGRVRDLLKAAELANCGLINGDSGILVLHARHVDALMLFAAKLIEMKDDLKPLSKPRLRRNRPPPRGDAGQLAFDIFQHANSSQTDVQGSL